MCSSSSLSSSPDFELGTRRQENGTMLRLSNSHRRRGRQSLLRHCYPPLFTFFLLANIPLLAVGASVTGAQDGGSSSTTTVTSSITSSSSSTTTSTSISDDHHGQSELLYEEIEHSSTESYVTKIGNGFERLVVSIDDSLAALLSQSSTTPATATSSVVGTSTGLKGASSSSSQSQAGAHIATHHQHECQTVLEQLKVLLFYFELLS